MTNIPVEQLGAGQAVLRPASRLDLRSAPQLRAAVTDAVESGSTLVVVDLSGVDFMDSSGLGALIAGLKTARQASGDLRICGPTEQVTMVLELTQMDRVLRAHPSVEAALGAG